MLYGSLVILREYLDTDIDFLMSLRNDVKLQIMLMALPRPNSIERAKEWLNKRTNDEHCIFFIIAEKATNTAFGYIQLANMDFINRIGELGICLKECARGKGYAKESLNLLEEYAHSIFGIRKVILKALTSNKRAISFYKKMEYSMVGVYKQHFYYNNMFHDVILMEKIFESCKSNT